MSTNTKTFVCTKDFRKDALDLANAIYSKKTQYELEREEEMTDLQIKQTKIIKYQAVHKYHKNICGPDGFNIFEDKKFYHQDEVARHGYCTHIEDVHYDCDDKLDPCLGDIHLCKYHYDKMEADKVAEKEKNKKEEEEALIGLITDFVKQHCPKTQSSIPIRFNKKKLFSNFI